MSRSKLDDLLRDVATLERPSGEVLEDRTLDAYRKRKLSASEAERVEEVLARSAEARKRLIELAALETDGRESRGPRIPRTSREAVVPKRRWPWAAALAAAAAVVALAIGLLPSPAAPLPEALGYEVTVLGVATARSEAAATAVVEVRAETVLRIELAPLAAHDEAVEFGVYRPEGDRVRRLLLAGPDELEASQGAAVFRAPASQLLGHEPGTYSLLIAVGRRGDLPRSVAPGRGLSPLDGLSDGGRRRVYRREVELVAAAGAEGPPAASP